VRCCCSAAARAEPPSTSRTPSPSSSAPCPRNRLRFARLQHLGLCRPAIAHCAPGLHQRPGQFLACRPGRLEPGDAEPTADPALLKDVIKKQVDQETRQLRAELNKLKQAQARSLKASNTPAKKPTRGATPQKGKRAPSTNKSNRSPRKPTSPHGRKRNDASAERPGNASPNGKRKPKNNNSSNQSKKKGKKPQRSNASNSRK